MRTIFITSFHPSISRNILATPVLSSLTSRGARVIVFVHNYKTDYFQKNFSRENVIIEGVDTSAKASGFRTLLFKRLAHFMLDTKSIRIEKRWKLQNDKKFFYFLASWVVTLLGKIKLVRNLIRFLDYKLSPFWRFENYFKRYKPDLIFSTDIQNEHDVCLLQTAKRHSVKTVGMVRSWDGLTSLYKGLVRVIPDKFLVWTEILRNEAVLYHDVPPEILTIVGKPHYDNYLKSPRMSRAEFCRMLGLNPSKKIIFFNPWGNMFTLNGDGDRYVMEILKEIDANIIVRFNPTLEVRLDGFEPSANMVLDKPGVVFKEDSYGDRDISEEDDLRLINELYHSDVVITSASTIAVDAAIFDKPLIGVALSRVPVSWWEGVEKFYHQEHFYNVMKTGGIRLCRTKEELLNLIGLYLKNPSRDAAGRKKIVEEQCWKLDGKASVRVSEFLLNYA